MAVKIPSIQQGQAPEAATVGRINNDVINPMNAMTQVTQASERLGGQAVDFAQRYEDQKMDSIAQTKDVEFELWHHGRIYGNPNTGEKGIVNDQRDPTVLFKKLNDDALERIKNDSDDSELSPRTNAMVAKRLTNRYAQLQMKALVIGSHQQQQYDNNYTNSMITLRLKGLTDSVSGIHADDESTFGPFNQAMGDLRAPIIKAGLRDGAVQPYAPGMKIPEGYRTDSYVNDDGKAVSVLLDPVTNEMMRKVMSKGISDSIQVAATTGDRNSLAVAKALKEQYGGFVDPILAAKVEKNITDAEVNQKSDDLIRKAQNGGGQAVILKEPDLDVRASALKGYTEQNRQVEANIKMAQENAANSVMNRIITLRQSGTPLAGSDALKKDPMIKLQWDNMAAKDKEKAIDNVDYQKHSSESAVINLHTIMSGQDPDNDPAKMTPEQFARNAVPGLNEAGQKQAWAFYDKAHSPTGAQVLSGYKAGGEELKSQFIQAGYRTDQWGKFQGSNATKYNNAFEQMKDYLDTSDHTMKPSEVRERAREIFAHTQSQDALKPMPPMPRLNAGKPDVPIVPAEGVIKAQSDLGKLTNAAKFQYIQQWRKANNSQEAPTTLELWNFINKGTGH